MSHTPTPWRISSTEGDGKRYIVADSKLHSQSTGSVLIAMLKQHRPGSADRVAPDEIQDANAERIVLAVNAHDELVALAHALVTMAETGVSIESLQRDAIAALAKAGEA